MTWQLFLEVVEWKWLSPNCLLLLKILLVLASFLDSLITTRFCQQNKQNERNRQKIGRVFSKVKELRHLLRRFH
jgi:hypothetical protein